MPQEIDGKTFYSQEEVDQQLQESSEKIKESEDKIADLENQISEHSGNEEELKEQLEEAKEKLKGEKDKEKNFRNLRQNKEQKEEEVQGLKKTVEETNKKLDEFIKNTQKEEQDAILKDKGIIGEDGTILDKNVKEKFDFYFAKVGANAKTKAEIHQATVDALILATKDKEGDNRLQGVLPRRNSSHDYKGDKNQESETSKEMRQDFGISDKDKETHGKGGTVPLF